MTASPVSFSVPVTGAVGGAPLLPAYGMVGVSFLRPEPAPVPAVA